MTDVNPQGKKWWISAALDVQEEHHKMELAIIQAVAHLATECLEYLPSAPPEPITRAIADLEAALPPMAKDRDKPCS